MMMCVKRPLRIIFNALAILSLLLCVATAVLWARSGRRWDQILLCGSHRGVILWSSQGCMRVHFYRRAEISAQREFIIRSDEPRDDLAEAGPLYDVRWQYGRLALWTMQTDESRFVAVL